MKKIITHHLILSLLLIISTLSHTHAQSDYYWVGGTGDWTDFAAHWATESGGSTFHTSAPTSADDVYFDENSFSDASQRVNLGSGSVNFCHNLDFTGVTNSPQLYGYSRYINIYGSMTLVEDMSVIGSFFYLDSDQSVNISTGKNTSITDRNTSYGTLYFRGSGPFILQDSILSGNIRVADDAVLDFNEQYIDVEHFIISSSYSGSMDMASTEVHVNDFYKYDNSSEYDWITTSSELYISDYFYSLGGSASYGNVILENEGYSIEFVASNHHDEFSFDRLTIEPGVLFTPQDSVIFLVDELHLEGKRDSSINISPTAEANLTFSKTTGSVDGEYLVMEKVVAAGGATFNANNSIDNGDNSGWNFTVPAIGSYYWVGGNGYWYDYENHWATSSGGTEFHETEPTQFDNVYFDENSFTSDNQTVYSSNNNYNYSCRNMDWSNIAYIVRFHSYSYHENLDVYGDLILSSLVDPSYFESDLVLMANVETDITTANTDWEFEGGALIFSGNGPFILLDSIKGSDVNFRNAAQVDLNEQYVDARVIYFESSFYGSIDMSSSEVHTNYLYNYNYSYNDDFELIVDQTSIHISDYLQINDEDYNYGNLTLENEDVEMNIVKNSSITNLNLDTLIIQPGSSIVLDAGLNINLDHLDADGTRSQLITLTSDETDTPVTITQETESVDATYLSLTDIHGAGGATFNADFSIDNGNNDGWNFTTLPPLDYYWVGGTGNWSDVSHWATSSGDTEFHETPPSRIDFVYFDENSFDDSDQSVTLDISVECYDMNWSGVMNDPQLISSSSSIVVDIYGSLTLSENIDLSALSSDFNLYSNNEAIINTSANTSLISSRKLNFYGNGIFTFEDNMMSGSIYLIEGSAEIDFNAQHFDIYEIDLNHGFEGTLDLSTSEIHVNTFDNNVRSGNNEFQLISDESMLYVSNRFEWYYTTYNYGNVVLEDKGNTIYITNINGYTTLYFDQLTIEPGVHLIMEDRCNIYMDNLVAEGTRDETITIETNNASIESTFQISSGTINASYLFLKDTHAAGGATFNANFSVDQGNNEGWTFIAPPEINYYWVGGSGNWSDTNHWATSSGGSTNFESLPGIFDNVVFDESSFNSTDQEVVIDIIATCHDLDLSNAQYTPSISNTSSTEYLEVYGSFWLSDEIDMSGYTTDIEFHNADSSLIQAKNRTFNTSTDLEFYGDGAYTLVDSLLVSNLYMYEEARVYMNDQFIDIPALRMDYNYSGTLNMSSSEIHLDYLQNYSYYWNTSYDVEFESSVLYISSSITSSNNRNFGNVTLENENATTYYYSSYGQGFTFDTLTIKSGITFRVDADQTLYLDELIAYGTVDNPISIVSNASGSQSYFSKTEGNINIGGVTLQDIYATGGATFNAINSTDNGNNEGWNFITDEDEPTFIGSTPGIIEVGGTYINLDVALNEPGDVFYVIESGVVINSPSVDQVIDGLNSDGETPISSGDITVLTENQIFSSYLTGLNPFTDYVIYLVARDIGQNEQAEVTSILFSTIQGIQELSLADVGNKNYGDVEFELEATSSAGLSVTVTSSDSDILSIVETTATINGVGTVTLTLSQEGDDSYAPATETIELTIGKRILTVTADNVETTYGNSNPTLAYSYDGFLGEDSESDLSVAPSPINPEAEDVGTYEISFEEGEDEIYQLNYVVGYLTVEKASLYATVEAEKAYGDINPELIVAYEGFVYSETASDLDGEVSASLDDVDELSDAGEYEITLSEGFDSNYDIISENGTLTIRKAELSVIVNDAEKSYGNENPDFELVYSGFVNNEDESVLDESIDASTEASAFTSTGEYDIMVSSAEDNNYEITTTDGILTINKAILTLTTNDLEKAYGDANPTFDGAFEYNGFVGEDDESVLDETPTLSLDTDETSGVGTYTISVNGSDNNYSYSVDGNLTVTKAALSASIDNYSRNYGEENPNFSVSFTGFVNDETAADLRSTIFPTTEAEVDSDAGDYDIYLNSTNDTNYEITSNIGTLTVNQVTLSVSLENGESTYGQGPSYSISYEGFIDGDSEDSLDELPEVTSSLTTSSDAGSYSIGLEGGSDINYEVVIVVASASYEINKATLQVSIEDEERIYGESNPTFLVNVSGFVNEEDESVLDEMPSAETSADEEADTGEYEITLSAITDNNYDFETQTGKLTINKASLTITADDLTRYVGVENPEFSFTYSGFVNDDSPLDIDEIPNGSCSATISSRARDYTISLSGGFDNNYEITRINGTLTILNTESQILTFDPIDDKVYGDEAFEMLASSTSGLDITFTSSDESIVSINGSVATIHKAGDVTITAIQTGNEQYEEVSEAQEISINRAYQTITFEPISEKTYGDNAFELIAISSSELDITFTSSDESIVSINGSVATIHKAGDVTITAIQTGNEQYEQVSEAQEISINRADQTVTFEPISEKTYGDDAFELIAISSSELDITFASSDESIVSINGSIATILGAGSIAITASQTGNELYENASETQIIDISKGSQTVTFESISEKTYGDDAFELIASNDTGLPLIFQSSDESILSISEDRATILSAGEVIVTVSSSESDLFSETSRQQTLNISKASQMITFETIDDRNLSDGSFVLVATSSSGLPVSFLLVSGDALLEESTITPESEGSITIEAFQVGNDNYEAASSVTQSFDITADLITANVRANNDSFSIHPNPASDVIKLEVSQQGVIHMTLVNLNGKKVFTKTLGSTERMVEINKVSKGSYILLIQSANNELIGRKLVIIK